MIQKTVFLENYSRPFYHFSKNHMKILLGDFNAKVEREVLFNLTMGNKSLHQVSNDNGVRIVNSAT